MMGRVRRDSPSLFNSPRPRGDWLGVRSASAPELEIAMTAFGTVIIILFAVAFLAGSLSLVFRRGRS